MSEQPNHKREAAFYRQTLEQIAQDKRRTRGRRLAESALTFWDAIVRENYRKMRKYENL